MTSPESSSPDLPLDLWDQLLRVLLGPDANRSAKIGTLCKANPGFASMIRAEARRHDQMAESMAGEPASALRQSATYRLLTAWRRVAPLRQRLAQTSLTTAWTRVASRLEDDPGLASRLQTIVRRHSAADRLAPGDELGRSPNSVVWRVQDQQLQRELAMKVVQLPNDGLSAESVITRTQRILDEARLTAALAHPNIVPVHQVGVDASGRVFYTMRLCRGENLERVVDRRHRGASDWPLPRTLGALLKVCHAVAFGHDRGACHGELHPRRVIVGDFGEVSVLGWGTTAMLTPADITRGIAADVNALGDMLAQILTANGHNAELEAIRDHATATDPTRRYPSVRALATDLTAYLDNRVVHAYESGAWAELRKWTRRNPALAATVGALFLSLVAGFAAGVVLARMAAASATNARTAAEQVEAETASLEQARGRFDLVAHSIRLNDAEAAEADLEPPWAEHTESFRAWLVRHGEPLVAALPEVRAAYAAIPADATGGSLFLRNTLQRLLADGERFAGPGGTLECVRARLSAAERAAADTESMRTAWANAIAAIAASNGVTASAAYGGLALVPQAGLAPLGMDPHSKLWEFVHVASGDAPQATQREDRTEVAENGAIVFVLVPENVYHVGEGIESEREVLLEPFLLAKHELTQGQWLRLTAGDQPSQFAVGSRVQVSRAQVQALTARGVAVSPTAGAPVTLAHPVENINWRRGRSVLARWGLRLPTGDEWEAACRAGTTTTWSTGDDLASLLGSANVLDVLAHELAYVDHPSPAPFVDGFVHTAPVGRFAPNAFGFHDMHGNVWEMCENLVDCGGAHNTGPVACRSAIRNTISPGFAGGYMGVRPARSLTQ